MGPFSKIEEKILANYPSEISAFLTGLKTQDYRPKMEIRLPYTVEIK